MASPDVFGDTADGSNGQTGTRGTDLTLRSDEGTKAYHYIVEEQLKALFTSFLNEKNKDDVVFTPADKGETKANIIYEYKDGGGEHVQFIIVASCENTQSITNDDLIGKGVKKFSLEQYFELYWNWKLGDYYRGYSVKVVIWTNATVDVDKLRRYDIILEQCHESVYVPDDYNQQNASAYLIKKLPDEFINDLNDQFFKKHDATVSENPVNDFSNDFIFYITPKNQFLNAMSVIGIKSTNPEKKLDHGDFFARTDDIEQIITNGSNIGVVHFISDSTALAFIKVAQALKNKTSIITYAALDLEYLLSYNEEITAVLRLANRFVLTVEIPKDKLMSEQEANVIKVLDTCTQICKDKHGHMVIVLIYNTQNQSAVNSWIRDEALRSNNENTTVLNFTFDQLNEDSQKRIRETKVIFQGQDVELQELLAADGESAYRYNRLLTQNVLDKKISNESMVIGNSLPGLTPEVKDCYIQREYAHLRNISAQSIADNFKGYFSKDNAFDNSPTHDASGKESELDTVDGLLFSNLQSERKNEKDGKKRKESSKTGQSKLSVQLHPGKEFIPKNENLVNTVIISTESTLFAEIAQKRKKINPPKWHLEISLEHHMDALNARAITTMDHLVDFLVIAGKPVSGSAKLDTATVSKEVKEGSNMVVFLDAFGEFWLPFKTEVFALVKIMQRSRIEQIWINTNPCSRALFSTEALDGMDEKEHHPKVHSTPIFNLIEEYAESDARMYSWENPDEDLIIGNIEARKIVVISGDPGTGKSVALGNIATKIKERCPDYWVIQTSLSDHTDFLKKIKDGKRIDVDLIEFLSAAEGLASDSTNIGNEILTKRVRETGKIIVLLDALDEVCPLYERQVVTMVNRMRATKIPQIWITTRPEFKNVVSTEHSYSLKDFKIDDQEYFINMYLDRLLKLHQTETDVTETDGSNKGIETCCLDLYHTITTTTDRSKLIGNALLARMAVEVYFNEMKESWQSMQTRTHSHAPDVNSQVKANSLPRLYEQFIKQRYCFHCEGKWKANTSNAILNMENKSLLFSTAYQRFAFEFLFHDIFKLFYASNDELATILTWDLIAIGIISETSKKIHFFHRTFAEYYVAQFMAKLLTGLELNKWKKEKTLKAKRKVEFLTFEHVKERSKMIRTFMDHFLSHGSEVHGAVLNDSFEELEKLVVKDERVTRKRDKLGRTPLHLACSYKRRKIADYLLNLDASLIADLDALGFGPACYAAIRGNEFFMKNILRAAANYNSGNNEHLRHVLRIYNLN